MHHPLAVDQLHCCWKPGFYCGARAQEDLFEESLVGNVDGVNEIGAIEQAARTGIAGLCGGLIVFADVLDLYPQIGDH